MASSDAPQQTNAGKRGMGGDTPQCFLFSIEMRYNRDVDTALRERSEVNCWYDIYGWRCPRREPEPAGWGYRSVT